jgi:hypothetical protein
MITSTAYLGFPGLGLKDSGSSGKIHLHVVSEGIKCKRRSKNVVLRIEPRALGVVGVSVVQNYGVPLALARIL